jgi:hypothetical protein
MHLFLIFAHQDNIPKGELIKKKANYQASDVLVKMITIDASSSPHL